VTAPVEGLAAFLLRLLLTSHARFKPRASRGTLLDDFTVDLLMGELWAIDDALCLRDFISAARDCTRGRLATSLTPGPASGPGPSLIPGMAPDGPFGGSLARLARALGATVEVVREVQGWVAEQPADDDDRAARSFMTYFGVGDAEEDAEA
jgi:hypothetical protein